MTVPQGPNQRWSLDFVADQLIDGRRFRVLVIVDDFTRVLALVVTPRSPASASSGSSRRSSPFAAGRSWWSATTAPN